MTSLYHKTSKGHVIDSFNYTLDNVGNRLTKTGMNTNVAYTYDAIYRLKQATGSHHHGAEQFTYDPMGNRLTGPEDEQKYTYNQVNQLTENTLDHKRHEDKNTEYAYDKNGNLVKKIRHIDHKGRHDETTLYTYDYENRLIKVERQKHHKQTVVSFTYDPFGRRLSKTVEKDEIEKDEHREHGKDCDKDGHNHHAPRTANFVYDNQDIILEYNNHGRVAARYIHGLGIDEHLAIEKKDEVYYYHADGLGSITALTDKKQHVVKTYEYDSFGNVKQDGNKINQPYTYTGREWDEEVGLYYYRARYYDAKNGRFTLQKDPIGFTGGINLYSYVGNNPVNFTDPKGLFTYSGNWCGPTWTGGKKEQFDGNNYDQYKRATDGLDSACQKHDICYARCRTMYPCDKAARGSCMTACDRTLAKDAEVYAQYTSPLWLWMNYNNSPDPGENDCSCNK